MEVEMRIRGLMMDPVTNMPIVVLKDAKGDSVLPIWVGIYEANAIALEIEKVTTPREISSLLHGTRTKKTFPVTVVRNKKELTLNVTLDENGRNGRKLEGPRELL